MMNQSILSNRGFSLVQTLVAVGISSIMAVGIAAAVANGLDGMSNARNFGTAEEISVQLSGMLADPDYCTVHFKGLKVEEGLPRTVNDNVVFKNISEKGDLGSTEIIKVGKRYQNVLEVSSLKLVVESSLGPSRYLGSIVVGLKAGNGYNKSFNRAVPIHLATDTKGKIVSCSRMSQPTQGTASGVWSETCTDFAAKGWPTKEGCLQDGRWHKVYSNSKDGAVTFGSFNTLAALARAGADVKVAIADGEYGFLHTYDKCAGFTGHETKTPLAACLVGSRPGIPNWSLMGASDPGKAIVYYTNGKVVYTAPNTHFMAGLHWYIKF